MSFLIVFKRVCCLHENHLYDIIIPDMKGLHGDGQDGLLPSSRSGSIIEECQGSNSFFQRLIGLVGRGQLHENEGFIVVPCNSVHTFFMRYRIDVVFLSRDLGLLRLFTI